MEGAAGQSMGSRKARTLVKLLAVRRGRTVAVDAIADVLWGEDQPARPAEQVGVLVSRLRRALGADRIVRRDGGYALVADWIDVAELDALTAAACEALSAGRTGAARAAAHAALALVSGPLLPEEEGDWLEPERAAVAAVVTAARRVVIDTAAASGDLVRCVALAEQVLVEDPYDEAALRSLMRAHLSARRPASALAAYARARARLAEDLGASPTPETEALHAAALRASDEGAGAAPAHPATQLQKLVGRDDQVRALDEALEQVAGGGTQIVLVEAAAGLGKTALVESWAASATDRAVVLSGRCDELGRDVPMQPLVDALATHLRGLHDADLEHVLGADQAALAPLLGPLSPAAMTVVADADAGRLRLYGALAGIVHRLGGERPVVLVLEDVHQASPGTLAWLGFVRPRCDRLLVVVSARTGSATRLQPDVRLRLHLLPVEAVRALVGEQAAAQVHRDTGGHPLLVAAYAEAADGRPLREALRDAVGAQLGRLDAAARATTRVAAALGDECDLDVVAQVARLPVLSALGHLESAAAVGLLVERGAGFAFRHELVREAVDATTSAVRRGLIHREAARVLAARPTPDMLSVAVHAHAGGDDTLAAEAFVAAAQVALARFDVEAAEAHLAQALSLAPAAAAYVTRARLRMGVLDLQGAADDAAQAVSRGGGASALETAGWIAYYQRRYADAEAYAQEAVRRAEGDVPVTVSARALAGRIRHGAGDLSGAVACLQTTEDAPLAVRGIADVWLAQARVHQGRPVDALASLRRPAVDPDSLAHPWAPLHLRFNQVLALGQLGRVEESLLAAADLDRAVARSGAIGTRFAGPAANATAWVLRWTGRGAEADEHNQRALEVSSGPDGQAPAGFAEAYYVALLDLADGRLLAGDPAGAAALAARLVPVDTWNGTMAWHQRHRLGLLRARLALAGGDIGEAREQALLVAQDAARRGASRYDLLARAVVALADPSVPLTRVTPVVEGLSRCAALEGWVLLADLAAARGVSAWREEAVRRAAIVVASSGAGRQAAVRFADAVLTARGR